MFHVKHSVFLPQNNDRIRPVGTRRAVSVNFGKEISRWKRSTGTFPKSRNSKRDTRAERSCSLRPRKASLFSPTFPVRQKHGAGISLSADSDSEGCSPSKNTSPAALSWSSLFGQTVLKSFCFSTMVFVTALAILHPVGTRRAVSADFGKEICRWKRSTGTFPKSRNSKRDTRAERSCSFRPRKAVAFLTHLPRAPEAWRREFRRLRTATQRAARPLRTPRQLRSAGAAFSGTVFQNRFVSARWFL